MTEIRTSNVVYVVACLRLAGRDCFLLHAHPKWGDWGLVGGHVEPWEEDDWDAAARREVDEEMEPLRVGRDLRLVPLPEGPGTWGPVPSRSAGGRPTVYRGEGGAIEGELPGLGDRVEDDGADVERRAGAEGAG